MEITAQNTQGFFRASFPENRVVSVGMKKHHDVHLPEYGGLGSREAHHWSYQPSRYEHHIEPYLPKWHQQSDALCQLMEFGGLVLVKSKGLVYTWFRDEPLHGTKQLSPGEPIHVNGVELAVVWTHQQKTIEEVAKNPELSVACLLWLIETHPLLVARNPLLPLLLLEDPTLYQRLPKALQEVIAA